MPSVRDLRDRIKSLKNTQQITKAMKQVAAAKIRRAEMVQKQARPYADALGEMLRDLMAAVGTVDHPFLKPGRSGAPKGVILMTADKGLAGAFNSNVVRAGERFARESGDVVWYAVGNKARNATKRMPSETLLSESISVSEKLKLAQAIAARVTDDFTGGKISEIVLIASKLVSVLVQRPEVKTLVPIVAQATETEKPAGPRAQVEFAPSPEAVLTRLLPKYLEFTIFSAMLETDAAFFAAQLIAMTNATDNAGKLLDDLTLAMNKARQAAITKEMLEIVGGAEAQAG
ncbi:MAG: ATP synthase F1 subunit gamma [Candidatus Eremiobacteraeota bacterium]|nr:ATP synthase F1 subunit gamma [Candidatus Eremiobacteraeota bacterium]